MRINRLVALLAALWVGAATAATIEPPLTNPEKESLARSLFLELRCVVCEGQSIADSDAVLAAQMRTEVRRHVEEGKSGAQVLAYFRERYGDQILMTPPLTTRTYVLWFAPLLLLVGGGYLVRRATRPETESA